jgi:hypothetical protein
MLEDEHSLEMVLQMLYVVHSKDRENGGMASGFGGEKNREDGKKRLVGVTIFGILIEV